MDRFWVLYDDSNIIVNVILWDGTIYDPETNPTGWTPPPDFHIAEIKDTTNFYIGATYNPKDGSVTVPSEIEFPDPVTLLKAQAQSVADQIALEQAEDPATILAALNAKIKALDPNATPIPVPDQPALDQPIAADVALGS